MTNIGDYEIMNQIDETKGSFIYRGKKKDENHTVIIKLLKLEYPSLVEIAQFQQEYRIIKELDMEGIIKTYDIIDVNNSFALILEDFNADSLKKIISTHKIDLNLFLEYAVQIADTLGRLHGKNVIHKDIKPQNILINFATKKVKITDFGISTVLTRENQGIYNPQVIQGTLLYMSPEQTERINRPIDNRSDLYSLGITFYQMLLGKVPFDSTDPLEIIHSHIAREPVAPVKINPDIPQVLSDIIMKLLQKNPEERYQNSFGLLHDLQECREQLSKSGQIKSFELGKKDIAAKYIIPQVILGRENEIKILFDSFERVANGHTELIFFTGDPGIGKSALINEIQKPIVKQKGYFFSGKFDPFRRDVPYSGIIQAFQCIIRQILTENESHIKTWKDLLLKNLGSYGKIIIDIIPNLELIIGKQPDVPEIGPNEVKNRFNNVFKNLINVFATNDHPLVLFFDDLQWADLASLNLIEYLMTDKKLKYLLLIGAYRNNEVGTSHPLTLMQSQMKESSFQTKTVFLNPIRIKDVNQLITYFLKCDDKQGMPLAELIYKKTNGNPFFINQFMKILYEEKMLTLNQNSEWQWDLNKIEKMQVTDNVVKLLSEKMIKLPVKVQNLLKICACIGNRFDIEMIVLISNNSIEEILSTLNLTIEEGFINYQNNLYKFHHDRIQEAAYSLISAEDKSKLHYKIGKILLNKTGENDLTEKIIYITDQLNKGKNQIIEKEETRNLARLNLMAAQKAKKSAAYQSSIEYLKTGIELLGEECWTSDYDLTFALYSDLMESEYLVSNFDTVQVLFQIIIKNTKGKFEKVKIYTVMANMLTLKGEFLNAIKNAIEGLKCLNFKEITLNPSKLSVIKDFFILLSGFNQKFKKIVNLEKMTKPREILILELFDSIGAPAGSMAPLIQAKMVFNSFDLYLKHGLVDTSPFGVAGLAPLVVKILKDYDKAYMICEKSIQLLEKVNPHITRSKVNYLFAKYVLPFKKHCNESIKYFHNAYKFGIEDGNLQFASFSIAGFNFQRVLQGNNLDDCSQEIEQYENFIRQTQSGLLFDYYIDFKQFYSNMKGLTDGLCSMNTGDYDQDKHLGRLIEKKMTTNILIHCHFRIIIYYLYHQYDAAYKIVQKIEHFVDESLPSVINPEYTFYYSLILIALSETADSKNKKKYEKKLKKNQKMMKNWSDHCPANYLHKYLLIKAEISRLNKDYLNTIYYYNQAVESAKENHYICTEAIIHELAAKFYISQKFVLYAKNHLIEARYCYLIWGATAKMQNLEKEYPQFMIKEAKSFTSATINKAAETGTYGTQNRTSTSLDMFDLSTVIKATQTISGEIVLSSLLEKMLQISLENAGAQKGILLLENKNKLFVEASCTINQEKVTVLESIPLYDFEDIAAGIVQYVARTNQTLILNDASTQGDFIQDSYILQNKPKSILCSPINNQGKQIGILYLENNLTTNAFTLERLEILKILSSQIAISIENARLYANLEDKVKERTKELNNSNKKLELAMKELWGEMELAKKIQTVLLPKELNIPGYDISAFMAPAESVGGDYYDLINTKDVNWIAIGDVSGHGVYAGLIMMMVQTAIHNSIIKSPKQKPSELLNLVNKTITANILRLGDNKFMSLNVFSINPEGEFTYSGLHQDILIYRRETGNVDIIQTKGVWIGIMEEITERINDSIFTLLPGDTVLLYTDGIIESWLKNSGNTRKTDNLFELKKLIEIFKKLGSLSTKLIVEGIIAEFHQNYHTDDDITLMAIKRVK